MHAPPTRSLAPKAPEAPQAPVRRAPPRRGRLAGRHRLLWAILPLVALTAGAIAWWWPQAWLPAALLLIVYATFAALTVIDARAHRRRGGTDRGRGATLAEQERVALGTIGVVVAGLAASAGVLASAILEARLVAVGAFAVFVLMVFIGLPFWAAAASEEAAAVRQGTRAGRRGAASEASRG